VKKRVAPEEAGRELRHECFGVCRVVHILSRHLIPDAEDDARDDVMKETPT